MTNTGGLKKKRSKAVEERPGLCSHNWKMSKQLLKLKIKIKMTEDDQMLQQIQKNIIIIPWLGGRVSS